MTELNNSINELKNVAQFIAHKLEEMILTGELAPGQHLIQTDIATQFGVSRLPVRDALKILEKRELAVTQPRRGVIVRPLNLQEVSDLYELRRLLESHAFTRSVRNLTEQDIADVEAILQRQESFSMGQFIQILDLDEQFHIKLCSRCENEEIKSSLVKIWSRIRVLRSLERDWDDWNKNSVKSHRGILAAIRAQDYKKARQLLEEGIDRAENKITASVKAVIALSAQSDLTKSAHN
ncbi:MAG: GntR family transcriptional regulator [Lacunisphaera sp.]|nr:GntR family transcriptional regulator [Lacunisphaera sp.]